MSVTYQQLLHNVAIRLNALVGSQVAIITGTYNTGILTEVNFKSADWPFGAFRDAILMAEEDFAWAVADTANHPWRINLASQTTPLADSDSIPAADSNGAKIIGVYGSVVDGTDARVLLEGELDEITRIRRLQTSGVLVVPSYLYRIDGGRIRHTRTNVVIEVCVYSRGVQQVAFGANGPMLLPDVLELGITSRAISTLTKETAFADQATTYAGYADTALTRIRAGFTSIGSKAVPVSAGGDA